MEALREGAEGLASSEEELLLLALFGEEAEPLLQSIRQRAQRGGRPAPRSLAQRPRRADPRRRADRAGDGRRRDHGRGGRGARERPPNASPSPWPSCRPEPTAELEELPAASPVSSGLVSVESPMVGTFYRSPRPGAAPFVEEGDPVVAGAGALHPRGDEADERGQGRGRGDRPADPRRPTPSPSSTASSSSSSSRSTAARSGSRRRCSARFSWRTGARSPSG